MQKKMLGLLKEIAAICHKYDIKWYLMYGALLGAVRHKGFIPWDDDLDIVMTHDNWVKFIDAFKQEQLPNRALTGLDVDASEYGQLVARYHDMTSEEVIAYNSIFNQKNGIYIDILILDEYPNTPEKRKDYIQTLADLSELAHKMYNPSTFLPTKSNYCKKIISFIIKGRQKEINRYIKKISSVGKGGSNYIQRYVVAHIYDKKIIDQISYITFEDMQVPIPHDFYEALCEMYSENWMHIPANKSGHGNVHSVKSYRLSSINDEYHAIKKGFFHKFAYFISKLVTHEYNAANKDWRLSSRSFAEKFFIYTADKAKEAPSDSRLGGILHYLAYQTNVWFIGRLVTLGWWNWYNRSCPKFIKVNNNFAADSIYLLLKGGGLPHACSILRAMGEEERKASSRLSALWELTSDIRSSFAALYYKEYEEAIRLTEKHLRNHPDVAYLWQVNLAAHFEAAPESFVMPADIPSSLDNDPELARFRAEVAIREQDWEKALYNMHFCAVRCSNAFVLNRIKELCQLSLFPSSYDDDIGMIFRIARKSLGETVELEQENTDENEEEQSETIEDAKESCESFSAEMFPEVVTTAKLMNDQCRKQAEAVTSHELKLVEEFIAMCRRMGLRAMLFGRPLLNCFREESISTGKGRLVLAMMSEDAKKFLDGYSSFLPSGRYVESPLSNPDFPEFAIYYGDSGTLDVHASSIGFLQNHGIHIVIRIIAQKPKLSLFKSLHSSLEKSWNMAHGIVDVNYSRLLFLAFYQFARLIAGRRRVASSVFRLLYLGGSSKMRSEDTSMFFWRGELHTVPTNWFASTDTADFCGEETAIPSRDSIENLLMELYKTKDPRAMRIKEKPFSPFSVVSTTVSEQEFFSYLDSCGFDTKAFWKKRLKALHLKYLYAPLVNKLRKDHALLRFLNDRYVVYKKLMPIREEILQVHQAGDFEKLDKMISWYVRKLDSYRNAGLCLNIDDQLLNIALEVMSRRGMNRQVKSLRASNKRRKFPAVKPTDIDWDTEV